MVKGLMMAILMLFGQFFKALGKLIKWLKKEKVTMTIYDVKKENIKKDKTDFVSYQYKVSVNTSSTVFDYDYNIETPGDNPSPLKPGNTYPARYDKKTGEVETIYSLAGPVFNTAIWTISSVVITFFIIFIIGIFLEGGINNSICISLLIIVIILALIDVLVFLKWSGFGKKYEMENFKNKNHSDTGESRIKSNKKLKDERDIKKDIEHKENQIIRTQAPILFCRKCGARLIEDSLFCNKCGAKVINPEE